MALGRVASVEWPAIDRVAPVEAVDVKGKSYSDWSLAAVKCNLLKSFLLSQYSSYIQRGWRSLAVCG